MKTIKGFETLKKVMSNPPPERLAAIEYRSNFMQILGVLGVCIILISKGLWYVIFAFVFSMGVSYSQGISAYQKYKLIMSMKDPNFDEDDKSPSRKRDKLIRKTFGKKGGWISITISALFPYIIVPDVHFLLYGLIYILYIIFIYIIFHYFMMYYLSIFINKLKGGNNKDAERKTKERS